MGVKQGLDSRQCSQMVLSEVKIGNQGCSGAGLVVSCVRSLVLSKWLGRVTSEGTNRSADAGSWIYDSTLAASWSVQVDGHCIPNLSYTSGSFE